MCATVELTAHNLTTRILEYTKRVEHRLNMIEYFPVARKWVKVSPLNLSMEFVKFLLAKNGRYGGFRMKEDFIGSKSIYVSTF